MAEVLTGAESLVKLTPGPIKPYMRRGVLWGTWRGLPYSGNKLIKCTSHGNLSLTTTAGVGWGVAGRGLRSKVWRLFLHVKST